MYNFVNFAHGTTFALNLYCFLLYCFLLFISLRGNVVELYTKDNYRTRTVILFCGLLLFALTSFVGADFFHYYEFMYEYRGQVFGDQEIGLEAFYQYLISFIDGNYFLFRLVVWGGSLVLIAYAARKFETNLYHTLFLILAGYIITFSYARATLAMAVFSAGAVLISVASESNVKKRVLPTILGLIIIACSMYFHRSMLPMIIISLGWLCMPWKRYITKYSLWLFPIFVGICAFVIKTAFEELFAVANSIEDDTGTLIRAEYYAEQEAVVSNVNGYIRLAFHYVAFYLPFLIIGNAVRSNNVLDNMDKRHIWLYQIIYLTLIFSTSFLFVEVDMGTLLDRYLYMSFIPMAILISSMKDSGLLSKSQYLWIVVIFIASNLFQLFAYVYSQR